MRHIDTNPLKITQEQLICAAVCRPLAADMVDPGHAKVSLSLREIYMVRGRYPTDTTS